MLQKKRTTNQVGQGTLECQAGAVTSKSGGLGGPRWKGKKNFFLVRSTSCILAPLRDAFWRRQWHPTPVHLSGKSHGQRTLVGCSPWDLEESDPTEWLHFHFSLSFFGEGNGNPLQCSCLENPRDGRAWWAAVYGVTQSWTQLKWLSSTDTFTDSTFSHPLNNP